MKPTDKLSDLLNKLIRDGDALVQNATGGRRDSFAMVDRHGVLKWSHELRLFVSLCGPLVRPWRDLLTHNGDALITSSVESPLAALKTVRFSIDEGLLFRFKDLVWSEAFADLSEQAEYLLSQGYFLAAGVILRAVLEGRLRSLCEKNGCIPKKERSTISDYNLSLYQADPPIYGKSMMQQVLALAAVGNDAAHNSSALTIEDVRRLANGLREFLARFEA